MPVRLVVEIPPGRGTLAASCAIAEAILKHPGNQKVVVVVPSEEGVYRATLMNRVDAFDPNLREKLYAAADCEVSIETDDPVEDVEEEAA